MKTAEDYMKITLELAKEALKQGELLTTTVSVFIVASTISNLLFWLFECY